MASSPQDSFRKFTGAGSITAAVVAAISGVLFLSAAGFDLEKLRRPLLLVSGGASRAELLRWGALTDMLGYYLLLAPLLVYLHERLRPKGPARVDLFTFAGLAYIVIGAAGAAVLAAVGPPLIRDYAGAGASQRAVIEQVFGALTNGVFRGLWQTLEVIPLGVWAIGIGTLMRARSRGLGSLLVIAGVLALLVALGRIIGLDLMTELAGPPALALIPLISLLLGLRILRDPTF